MKKEQIFDICDTLINQLTILKGYLQLIKMNNKIDRSIVILHEIENIEKTINELVIQLIILD